MMDLVSGDINNGGRRRGSRRISKIIMIVKSPTENKVTVGTIVVQGLVTTIVHGFCRWIFTSEETRFAVREHLFDVKNNKLS